MIFWKDAFCMKGDITVYFSIKVKHNFISLIHMKEPKNKAIKNENVKWIYLLVNTRNQRNISVTMPPQLLPSLK